MTSYDLTRPQSIARGYNVLQLAERTEKEALRNELDHLSKMKGTGEERKETSRWSPDQRDTGSIGKSAPSGGGDRGDGGSGGGGNRNNNKIAPRNGENNRQVFSAQNGGRPGVGRLL